MTGQLVLPCCAPSPSKGVEWIAERYPVTAEELATIPEGVRLARLMNDEDCKGCQFCAMDHTAQGRYCTKICLRDLKRLKLWKPEDEPWYRLQQEEKKVVEWYPSPPTERTYRILHKPTHTWAELNADSTAEAVRIAGPNHPDFPSEAEWRMEDCWVRQNTGKGWGNPRE